MNEQERHAERERLLAALGENVRAERERQNISQRLLAERANVHLTQISALELGKRDPRASMLLVIADALGVQPAFLLDGLSVPKGRNPGSIPRGATVRRTR